MIYDLHSSSKAVEDLGQGEHGGGARQTEAAWAAVDVDGFLGGTQ